MSVLIFIVILGFLVLIHEAGHFIVARRAGMKVEEFGLGYPPKAKTLKVDKHGTEYTLNWLPFGGFVRIFGEDGMADDAGGKRGDGAFFTRPVWVRLLVVWAGATINFLFGVVAFGVIYTWVGIPTEYDFVKIEEVSPGSPAEESGVMPGMHVTSIDASGQIYEVTGNESFVRTVGEHKGETVILVLEDETRVPVYVRTEAETPAEEGSMGVTVVDYEVLRYPVWEMPFKGMAYGLKTAVQFGVMLLSALGDMAKGLVAGRVPKDVAGPVGIAYMAEREGILSGGFLEQLNFAAILSINLAIVNVLPIPALDGGRAIFLIYEGITRKRVKPEIEQKVNTFGFAALLLLLVLVSVRDVSMVVGDENVQNWARGLFGH